MNRRNLFLLMPAAIATIALTACNGVQLTSSQLDTDAEAVADGVAAIATDLEAVVPATQTALLAEIESAATEAGQNASALNSLLAPANAAALVTGIVAVVEKFDPLVVQFFPPSAPVVYILNAALALLPGLLADVNASTKMKTSRLLGTPMSASDARAYLAVHTHPRSAAYR